LTPVVEPLITIDAPSLKSRIACCSKKRGCQQVS
jgi:hypothetical protein